MVPGLTRWALGAVLAVASVLGFLAYRSSLITDGRALEVRAAAQRQTAAITQAKEDADLVTRTVVESLNNKLTEKDKAHDLRTRDLELALAVSDLRGRSLSTDIARLLDDAAGVRPGTPSDPSGAGGAAGKAEADPPADADLAEFVRTVGENYEICQRNSLRLEGLQSWYLALLRGPLRPRLETPGDGAGRE
ncbi:hypothetical protein [Rhizobacter sp. Root1221]|uniref:hypothetical protein n=1 Tax=Rhizobacter sp. Root1221 TaxID=1736433 RepID=UPI0012FB015D|nr:hypothetical protein [Rhizobacter sp. Root1221]